ncbi:hypothetical protein DHEL01_v206288 [Diaporthe helianthi]|uniref:Hyaluronan/mRNA-binding protein domain-containing protein n=1 Tax=Diaporthe helianthi TaxID=158607 RepID=A0A2P5HYJ0_DIAHE|nr:hypothetical protein DHEL01_v206288 [Diaporthe helianthi]
MSVASKNLYDLLGNDTEEGSENPAPVKTVTKASTKTGKANADGTGPASSAPASGARSGGGFSQTEKAYRDRGVGSGANRGKPTDEAPRGGARGGRGARGRGGRGATHHRNADDRHTKNIAPGSEKQAAQSWGANEGTAELNDEQAGEAIAQSEKKDAEAEDAEAVSQEPEVKTMSLDAFYAQREVNRAALNATTSVRQVEGGNEPTGEEYVKDEGDEFFIKPSKDKKNKGSKGDKDLNKKFKTLEIDHAFKEERTNEGRGGGRGRGGERGDRRGGPARGRGGASRGDGPPRGGQRGGRGGAAPLSLDHQNFPGLGGK